MSAARNEWKYDQRCLCDQGKTHAELNFPEHGWKLLSGQCCDCVNIRVTNHGNVADAIHICDLPAFILALQQFQEATSTTQPVAAPKEPCPGGTT